MIEGKTGPVAPFVASMAEKARQLAEAAAETRLRARRGNGRRWRLASLLWPLLAKGR